MNLHKSPLQILQSLTQKKFNESKKEKTVFPAASDIYLGKNIKVPSVSNNDIYTTKKSTVASYMKSANTDVNNNVLSQAEPRAKSPARVKRTIAKGNFVEFEKIQMNPADRPPTGLKTAVIVKDPMTINNGDPTIIMDRKTNDAEVNELVKAKLELAYYDYQQEDYNSALNKLLKAEEYIDKTLSAQTSLSFGIIHLVFYNLISTEYKLRSLGECKIYINHSLVNCHTLKEQRGFKGTLANYRSTHEQSEYVRHIAAKSLHKKYRCKTHLQACLIHSELENHIEAYAHAKQASKLACQMLTDALIICYHLYLKSKESKTDAHKSSFADLLSASTHTFVNPSFQQIKPSSEGSGIQVDQQQTCETEPDERPDASPLSESQVQYIENMIPILEEMVCRIKGRSVFNGINTQGNDSTKKKLLYELRKQFMNMELKKPDMNTLYGNLTESHFMFNTNIMGVAQIQPINPPEFNENWKMLDALKPDTLIEQILLMVVSLYALSTELRFWDEVIKRETPQKVPVSELMTEYLPLSFLKRESQLWIGRSLEFAYTFLPHHCPIAEQIFSIYSKLYNPTKFMIPEDEEIRHFVKYLNPTKGIARSAFFFVPLIRKSENEEDDGIATLLFTEKELDNSLSKAIKQIQLFDVRSKYYDVFTKNYSIAQPRRDSRDTQMNFYNKINKLLKSSDKPQSVGKSVHLRKTYLNKSPMPKEEKSSVSGSEFLIAEDKDQTSLLSKENNNSYMAKKIPLKRNSGSPLPFSATSNRPSSKGGLPQSEPRSPVMRKSREKIDYTLPDPNRRGSLVEISGKEGKSRSFTETYNNSKIFFRPNSSSVPVASLESSKQQSFVHNSSKTNQSSTFYAMQNHEVSTLEETMVVREGSARQYSSDPSQAKEKNEKARAKSANKTGARPLPDGKIRVLNRRASPNTNKEIFSQIEGSRVENQDSMSIDKTQYESSMVVMTEPNERSTSQENERYVKKYIIPEKGPIRAMTSLRTRMKTDTRTTHTEGDEDSDIRLPGRDIYSMMMNREKEPRVVNPSIDLMQALKKRSISNEKKATSKITIVTIKKGKKGA